jgi:hypothetical protein
MYHSIIIEESLKNPEVLKNYKIIRTKFSAEQNWHLHIIEVPEIFDSFISEIQNEMVLDKPYYFHIYDQGKTLVIVFKDKIFNINPADESTWQEAREYGSQKLNIPAEQLDFYPTKISQEDDWYGKP